MLVQEEVVSGCILGDPLGQILQFCRSGAGQLDTLIPKIYLLFIQMMMRFFKKQSSISFVM
jgi:hypothetical protein